MPAATSSTERSLGSFMASGTDGCMTRRFTAPCNEGRSCFLRLIAVDAPPSGPMPERRTILVTDDSGANRDLLCGQLSTLGFWTEAATNGEEAVRAARRLMPDLILMDVEMPVMNGHDACKQLKADPATAEDQEVAFHAGLLHDIGQIGLSEELLNKQGSLTPEEFAQIKQHTILGAEIAGPFRPASVLAPAIRHHHERWDGTGYPDKLQGPAIPMMARIVAVADAFHAMITDRPYRPRHTVARALEILAAGSGTQWDPRLTAAFATSSLPQRIAGAAQDDQAKIA